ncbi:C40 family peptidase [Butyrivibrio sp.]|uniref:C40 family peptidase n=1 Tax=Butyrivibrio sp. TaxID=28121 RepID=UPI002FE6E671
MATVTTTTLKVRSGPGLDQEVLGLVPIEDELVVEEELDGWVKVSIEEGDGYVSLDYVTLSTEFVEAESKAEEEARLAKEKAAREAANAAAKTGTSKTSGSSSYNAASSYTTATSSIGSAVAQFAQQFVGNPYVYGGTSLTNGADCSGFVMSVYANFGVSLPHSSGADRSVGSAVDGLANAQPGDIICYSGHVAIYIGGGQIVHASTAKTGIKISSADYRTVLAVRRIF